MIDRRPALIAQCESVADVQTALAHAQANGLEIAIRSGGHSVAGASTVDGGLVIDLRRMNDVEVDPEAKTATVGGGATWSDFDRATQPHGLATTGGRVSSTGVAGLTLGGGSGWLERDWGLACDNLLEVDIVAADGRVVTANEDENSELFWALHGGSGNFGIATRLVFRLHPLPASTFAILAWPSEVGPELTRAYRDLIEAGAPTELGGGVAYLTGPPEPFVPEHLHNERVIGLIGVFAGTEAEMRDALAPIYALEPQGGLTAEMPYAEHPVRHRRSAGLPQLLVGLAPREPARRGARALLPSGRGDDRALAVPAPADPVGRRRCRASHGLADDASRRHVGDPSIRSLG